MVVPGTLIGSGVAGPGCYERNDQVYASKRGTIEQQGNIYSIETQKKFEIGMNAVGRVLKITTKQATVQLISVEGELVDVQATLWHKDMIIQYEKYETRHLVRPMDIVKVKIISIIPLQCSIVDQDCGVVIAELDGERLVPISKSELKSIDGQVMKRKVAISK
jgi:exosome complex RNA-binding protein Csl4